MFTVINSYKLLPKNAFSSSLNAWRTFDDVFVCWSTFRVGLNPLYCWGGGVTALPVPLQMDNMRGWQKMGKG